MPVTNRPEALYTRPSSRNLFWSARTRRRLLLWMLLVATPLSGLQAQTQFLWEETPTHRIRVRMEAGKEVSRFRFPRPGAKTSSDRSGLRQEGFPPDGLQDLMEICLSLGHLDAAEDVMKHASVLVDGEYRTGDTLNADHLTVLGQIRALQGRDKEAETALDRANQIRESLVQEGKLTLAGRARHGKTLALHAEVLKRLHRSKEARQQRGKASMIQKELVAAFRKSLSISGLQMPSSRLKTIPAHRLSPPIGGPWATTRDRFTGEDW